MNLILFLRFSIVLHHTFGSTLPDIECCQTKSVGSVEYVLADTQDTSTYECIDNCVYTKLVDGQGSLNYCFKTGDLPVYCQDENGLGSGETTTEPSIVLMAGGNGNGRELGVVDMIPVQRQPCYVQDLPQPNYGNTMVLTPKQILLNCGGQFSRGEANCLTLVVPRDCTPDRCGWVHHSFLTTGRVGAVGVTLPGGTYMFGGVRGTGDTADFMPASSNTWQAGAVANLEGGTQNSCGVAISQTEVVIIGGNPGVPNRVIKYSARYNDWTPLTNLIVGRFNHACAVYQDQLIVAGGSGTGGPPSPVLASTEIISLTTGKHRLGGDLHTPRQYLAMVTLGSKVLAIGGYKTLYGAGLNGNLGKPGLASIEEWEEEAEEWKTFPMSLPNRKGFFGNIVIPTNIVCPFRG